jgi:predicted TIM-barrel fold metal-dependent hydrolase
LPLQDATAAADELERCVHKLGFKSAMVNGHTNDRYLNDPARPSSRRADLSAPARSL